MFIRKGFDVYLEFFLITLGIYKCEEILQTTHVTV